MTDIIFIANEAEEGGYYAKAADLPIFTQAETLQELREMIRDAVDCHFGDNEDKPKLVQLLHTHNEVFAL